MADKCVICKADAPQRCGACGEVRYCGREHQRLHWKKHKEHCRPFKVCRDTVLGRHLVATRDIRVGESLLRESPLVLGPGPGSPAVCLGCLEALRCEEAATPCERCGWPLCGSATCASSDSHRPECDLTATWREDKVRIRDIAAPAHPMYEAVLALRLMWMRDAAPTRWQRLQELESHCALRRGTPRWDAECIGVAKLLLNFFGAERHGFNEEDIMRVLGILQVNGHEVPLVEPAYVAVYDIASLLEHSCAPNCSKSFSMTGEVMLRAARPINKGDHLSICYTDALWGTANRRHHLHETKFFWCRCERCSDPTEFKTYFSALRCPTVGCGGCVTPRRPLAAEGSTPEEEEDLDAMHWACVECTRHLVAKDVFLALNEAGSALAYLLRGDARQCLRFLERWGGAESPLAPDHFYLTDARLALAQLLGAGEGGLAAATEEDLCLKEQLCRRLIKLLDRLAPAEHRVRGLLRFELHSALAEAARRQGQQGVDIKELRHLLLESHELLEVSYELLRHEPACLPEGQMAVQAERNLRDLRALLRTVHEALGGDSPL